MAAFVARQKQSWQKVLHGARNRKARTCERCRSVRPGMQPPRLNGKRGYWHIACFEMDRAELRETSR